MKDNSGDGNGELFIAFTPYHVILALAVSKSNFSTLIVVPEFSGSEAFIGAISKHTGFDRVVSLDGTAGIGAFREGLRVRSNANQVRRLVASGSFSTLCIFNDSRLESQVAVQTAGSGVEHITFVEDGDDIYRSTVVSPSRTSVLKNKLKYGSEWSPIGVLGTYWDYDANLVQFPGFVRDELCNRPSEPISREALRSAAHGSWAEDYLRTVGSSKRDLADVEVLIIVPHPEELVSGYVVRSAIKKSAAALAEEGATVAIKRHPRDFSDLFVFDEDHPRIRIPPSCVPSELIVGLSRRKLRSVIGVGSTAHLTAARLCDDSTEVIAWESSNVTWRSDYSLASDRYLAPLYRHLGIQIEGVPVEESRL